MSDMNPDTVLSSFALELISAAAFCVNSFVSLAFVLKRHTHLKKTSHNRSIGCGKPPSIHSERLLYDAILDLNTKLGMQKAQFYRS